MINGIKIAPSILSADFSRLGEEVREAAAAGADYIHIDVMDGRFVPVISFGTPVVDAVRKLTDLTLDIHLMIEEPERHVGAFMDAGGDIINVHVEACRHLHRVAQEVHSRGKRVGACLNPGTPVSAVDGILGELDQVMVMSVNPGWSGQRFIEGVLPKVERLRRVIDEGGLPVDIEMDGGVTSATAARAVKAGACVLVAASAVFQADVGITEAMQRLQESVRRVRPGV